MLAIRKKLLTVILLTIVLTPVMTWAVSGDWQTDDQHRIRIVAPYLVAPTTGEIRLGVQFKLSKGWHGYWKNSGESAFPPSFDFSQSQGLVDPQIEYPAPVKFIEEGDIATFGYSGEVVYLVKAKVLAGETKAVSIKLKLNYLICEKKCIPKTQTLTLKLPVGTEPVIDPEAAKLLAYWEARLPVSKINLPDLDIKAGLMPAGNSVVVMVHGGGNNAAGANLFPEAHDKFLFGRIKAEAIGQSLRFTVPLTPVEDDWKPVSETFVMVITGLKTEAGSLAVKTTRTADLVRNAIGPGGGGGSANSAAPAAPAVPQKEGPGLGLILLLGVLGGLILNLMPCVLPVLSLKVFAVIQSASEGRREVVVSNLATSAGIISSFLMLAIAAALARQGGLAVGWGVQFQEPLFVTFLAVVVLLFCLNLWGLFEIPMPAWASRLGGSGSSTGIAGHFATGLFATLLATPCSAPFLGTAVGFSLTQSVPVILLTFAALGLGMSLPYLMLAAFPGLAGYFPRPGMWMQSIRIAMGFLLIATEVWLVYVLAAQVSSVGVAYIQASLIGLAFFVWLAGLITTRIWLRRAAWLAVLILALGTLSIAAGYKDTASTGTQTANQQDGLHWIAFDEQKLLSLNTEGKTVLVNMTADWCFTCKAVEKAVLHNPEVVDSLKKHGVVTMRGDWTNRNDDIAGYMARFGRYGVPFNQLYRPGKPPHLFGEVFTRANFLEVLEEVK